MLFLTYVLSDHIGLYLNVSDDHSLQEIEIGKWQDVTFIFCGLNDTLSARGDSDVMFRERSVAHPIKCEWKSMDSEFFTFSVRTVMEASIMFRGTAGCILLAVRMDALM